MNKIMKLPELIAIMKHGLCGYEGEYDLWKTEEVTFFHILVRMAEEMKIAAREGFPFYPYLTTTSAISTLDLVKDRTRPIDLCFTPVADEYDDWPENMPDLDELEWECDDDTRHTKIEVKGSDHRNIPCPIRLGDGEVEEYSVLLITELELFPFGERLTLDFSHDEYEHISSKKPIKTSFSGQLTFGVFQHSEQPAQGSKDYKIKIAARAKLVPPYRGKVYP